jgi:hypothetical protein
MQRSRYCRQYPPGAAHTYVRCRRDCVFGRELQPTETASIGEHLRLHRAFVLNYYLLYGRTCGVLLDCPSAITSRLDEYLINFGYRG